MVAEVGMGSWKRVLGALQVFSHVEFISLQERPRLLIMAVGSYYCQRYAIKLLGLPSILAPYLHGIWRSKKFNCCFVPYSQMSVPCLLPYGRAV